MVFWRFSHDQTLASQMSDGKYLVVLQQPMDKIDTFDMERSYVCPSRDINVDA